ncbi:hypothetical protein [Rhodopseudomonas pseudopalustris]|uniref:Uncharacterized protein n=1 Tax=Rhodopseudomonas pseudopalustris TaxID=1513892 RepID=A0A1H8T546_9BRAD|nr:hypothetical protein [Rhodopseudomonas pseudopalustris]SEO85638.1 hypothetical protein SAMN05444123_105211 [Rhodopseudomonas pseudopalustris]
MLGNCIFRNPATLQGTFDRGSLCEALLFFERAHLLIDLATLSHMAQDNFLDDLIILLKDGRLTGNYSPQAAVMHTNNENGIREHFFTVVRFGGDQSNPKMRNPELLEQQLQRQWNDKSKARRYFRQLADLITFDDLGDNGVPTLGRSDLCDPQIAKQVATMALLRHGVPPQEISFSKIDVLPLGDFKFAISTDIDFDRLRRFIPEADRAEFGPHYLFPAISDARFDVGLAATHNAAFVGNEQNQLIVSMILNRSLGGSFNSQKACREIYDFISLSVPSIREVINSNERSTAEFIKLLANADSFRGWMAKQNPNADLVKEMLREKARESWLDSLPVKAMRFGLFNGAGAVADVVFPGASVATGLVDSFLVERLGMKWRPHFFVENHLKGFLDKEQTA